MNGKKSKSSWNLLPVLAWQIWLFFIPISFLLIDSFGKKGVYGGVEPGFSLTNYIRAFDPLYFRILGNSLQLSLITSALCSVIGFPMAYAIATAKAKVRPFLLFAIALPFLCNFVVRIYALKVVLSFSGPLNSLLLSLGWVQTPLAILNTPFAVILGMVLNYLPFFVLPLLGSLERFDFTLLEAAKDLGANRTTELFRVLIPGLKTGLISGFFLVFIPCLGEFLIPDLLGGSQTVLLGGLITDQFLKSRDWPFGSALGALLLMVVWVGLILRPKEES